MISTQNTDIIPENWYNVVPDLPEPMPPPRDNDMHKSSIELLNRILPKKVIEQEFTFKKYERIPDEVIELYEQIGRPTPLVRAKNLERYLNYKGKIYYKFEGATVTGSHKINTAIPQAYYAANEGIKEVTTETGAGQWGTATALASSMNGMKSKVFMVNVSYQQKPLRKTVMNLYGSEVVPSPSPLTPTGRKFLSDSPNHPGSLGIAISEAVEYALENNIRYLLGSVMNSVITHQSIIGLETQKQLEIAGEEAEVLIGCVGGGSNFGGFVFPIIRDGKERTIISSTAREVPKFSKGKYKYDYVDNAGILPSIKMYSLGSDFVPESIYAGGLRYHGASPSLSLLVKNGTVKSEEIGEKQVIEALRVFANTQGIVAAPESGHALASAINYVKSNQGERKTIVVNVSGHGLLDMSIFNRG
ncbi:TrpB-like pyridoxal phosphate-dependent enzyme [Oxyplasma meridianum]|uniref:Tryptophan synthase beta chain n=1 Tax=Oxyplasma meridianum TaxID=3073602 RepID=A0AAX4NFA0_9ARCH